MSENKENHVTTESEAPENNVIPIRPELQNYADGGKRKKRFGNKFMRLTVLSLIVVAVICLLIFGNQFSGGRITRFFTSLGRSGNGEITYSFDDGQKNVYAAYQNSLAVVSGYGLTTFDAAGEELGTIQHVYSAPSLQVGNTLVMVCDIGSNQLTVMDEVGDTLIDLRSTGTFLDANISSGDTICCVEIADGYRGILSAYDDSQNRIYRWYSSSGYFNQCAVSPDASYLCAIRLGNTDSEFESTAVIFRTNSEDPIEEVPLGDQLISEVCFLNNSTVAIIGENSTTFLNNRGDILNEYDYNAAHLRDYSVSRNGFIALSLNMYQAGNQYSVVTLNAKGEKQAEQYIGEEITKISAGGSYCAVLTPSQLLVYDQNLSLYASNEELQAVSSVVMLEDGAVILLGGGSGTLSYLR